MPFGEEILARVGARDAANLKYSTSGIDNVRQHFTGYEKDIETDLDFAEARMYQGRHGRFTAPDLLLSSASLDNPQTFNRYVYVGNNPVNVIDPSGLIWCRNDKSGSTRFSEKATSCQSGETDVTGKTRGIQKGSIETVSGYDARAGDVVTLNANGTATLVSVRRQQAEQVEVQMQAAPAQMVSTIVSISTTVQTRPLDLLPLPCPTGVTCSSATVPLPRLDTTNNLPLGTVAGIEAILSLL